MRPPLAASRLRSWQPLSSRRARKPRNWSRTPATQPAARWSLPCQQTRFRYIRRKADKALDLAIIGSIYDKLADIGDALNTTGDAGFTRRLAENWQWASDSLSIAFTLRADAKFHDGVPVRAEDVRFTFKAYTDTRGQTVSDSYLSNIDSISVPDSLTAVFWFKRRTPQQFFDATYHMYILPSHLLANIPIEQLGTDSVTTQPVGSGRFRYNGRVPQQRIEMVSDTGNYRGRAKVDRVVWGREFKCAGRRTQRLQRRCRFFREIATR